MLGYINNLLGRTYYPHLLLNSRRVALLNRRFEQQHWVNLLKVISLAYCGLCCHIAVSTFLFDHLIKAVVIHNQFRPQVDTLPVSLS